MEHPWREHARWWIVSVVIVTSLLTTLCRGAENLQRWSESAYLGEVHTFACTDPDGNMPFNVDTASVNVKWTKRGNPDPITNDDLHLLTPLEDYPNMQLTLKGVTEEMSGIYICNITSTRSGEVLAQIIKGLNLGGPEYADLATEYRTNMIIGFFAAFVLCAVVSGTCWLCSLDYCKPEQRERRRLLDREREEQQRRVGELSFHNLGMTSSSRSLDLADGGSFARSSRMRTPTREVTV